MSNEVKSPPLKVGLISLGCAKNLVDAEIMLGTLLRDGMEITNAPAEADVVIVNTCSFIDSAQEESVDTILESAEVRDANNRGQALIVAGCLSQRFKDTLPKLLPEVDAFMGIDQVTRVGEICQRALQTRKSRQEQANLPKRSGKAALIGHFSNAKTAATQEDSQPVRGTERFGNTKVIVAPTAIRAKSRLAATPLVEVDARPRYIPDYETPRFRLTPRHFAYLKIAEGCNHPCSFCIIPSMRGSHRSRQQQDVVAEAKMLLLGGAKEINLISQDSTYYGLDLRANHSRAIASPARFNAAFQTLPAGATTICTLLRELNELPGDFWIRLLYTHPAHWTDELVRTIAECPKVARYVDIPLQHIHSNMLERMRRETSQEHIVDLLRKIRAGVPGITLRTTFIVGFPGETEECFDRLLEFIRETRFERLGVFTYSREEGTRAGNMAGQVPEAARQRRRKAAMELQRQIASEIAAANVGRTLKVLVERAATGEDLRAARVSSWEHQTLGLTEGERAARPGCFVARGEADAPDIDGRIYVQGRLTPGEFAQVTITGHTDYDLSGVPESSVKHSH